MPMLPISKNQLDKLGDRLRDAALPSEDDLKLLEEVVVVYNAALQHVRSVLHDLGFAPTVRLKTTGTLVDKLRRDRNSSLKTVQDLAGARVVILGRLSDQDQARKRIVQAFTTAAFEPNVIDRRTDPRAGYRAVHVIVKVDAIPVEIQIRTELQDLWAQVFERLGDVWGRAIRYGGDPDVPPETPWASELRRKIVMLMHELSRYISDLEEECMTLRTWPVTDNRPQVDGGHPGLRDLTELSGQYIDSLVRFEGTVRNALVAVGKAIDQEVSVG